MYTAALFNADDGVLRLLDFGLLNQPNKLEISHKAIDQKTRRVEDKEVELRLDSVLRDLLI